MPRYALITGASSGIGLALAEALARKGRQLILLARQRDALESIASELTQRFGVEVLFRVCDLSDPMQVTGLLQELEQSERQIDLLVNNAGFGTAGAFLKQDWAREQQLIEVNILALARLCHAVGQHMRASGGGQMLNVASVAGFQPGPGMSNYYASKAYVLSLSEGLREEFLDYGIKVSVLCPGPTRSAFFRNAQMKIGKLERSALMMSCEEVALIAVRGLEQNRAIIIPGWSNKLMAFWPRLAPRALVRRVVGKINRASGGRPAN